MIWAATSFGWECDLGRIGWLEVSPDVDEKWVLVWSNFGMETVLSTHETAEAAKSAGLWWVDIVRTEIGNVSCASRIVEDDGA